MWSAGCSLGLCEWFAEQGLVFHLLWLRRLNDDSLGQTTLCLVHKLSLKQVDGKIIQTRSTGYCMALLSYANPYHQMANVSTKQDTCLMLFNVFQHMMQLLVFIPTNSIDKYVNASDKLQEQTPLRIPFSHSGSWTFCLEEEGPIYCTVQPLRSCEHPIQEIFLQVTGGGRCSRVESTRHRGNLTTKSYHFLILGGGGIFWDLTTLIWCWSAVPSTIVPVAPGMILASAGCLFSSIWVVARGGLFYPDTTSSIPPPPLSRADSSSGVGLYSREWLPPPLYTTQLSTIYYYYSPCKCSFFITTAAHTVEA